MFYNVHIVVTCVRLQQLHLKSAAIRALDSAPHMLHEHVVHNWVQCRLFNAATADFPRRVTKLTLSVPGFWELPPVGPSEMRSECGRDPLDMVHSLMYDLTRKAKNSSEASHALLFGQLDLKDNPFNADRLRPVDMSTGKAVPEAASCAPGRGGKGSRKGRNRAPPEPARAGHSHPSGSLLDLPAIKSPDLGQPNVSLTVVLQLLRRVHLHLQHIWDNGHRGAPQFWEAIAQVTVRLLGLAELLVVSMHLPSASHSTGLVELGLALHALAKSEFLATASDILDSQYHAAVPKSPSDGMTKTEVAHWAQLHIATKVRVKALCSANFRVIFKQLKEDGTDHLQSP